MTERVLFAPGGSTEDKQDSEIAAIVSLQSAIDDGVDVNTGLDLSLLATGMKQDAEVAKLELIRLLLAGVLTTSDVNTLAKLEQIRGLLVGTLTTTVSNMIAPVETGLNKEVTQLLNKGLLQDIKSAVEAISIDADTIAIDADTLNLSTDQLESILQQIRDQDIVQYALQATNTSLLLVGSDIVDALQDGNALVGLVADTFVKDTVTASVSGVNTVFPCPFGQQIRLYFFGYSAAANVAGVTVALQWEGFSPMDRQYLVAPGQPYARNIKAGNGYIDGPVDCDLQVNLSAAQTVHVNYELEVI